MIGIENITNNNGLAMAAVGAAIVFLGLVVLTFVISQIHKILNLWDEKEKFIERFRPRPRLPKKPMPLFIRNAIYRLLMS